MSECLAELVDADLDGLNHKLWSVVALQLERVLLRVFLWEHECLLHFSIIEIGEIDTTVVTISSTAGTHHPMSVA
jgi:hypothetical protein